MASFLNPAHKDKLPKILVLGATGNNGGKVVEYLEKHSKEVTLRYSSRRQEQVNEWSKAGKDAVVLDLDDPTTFPLALNGVDRIFLVTGYTVAMLAQSKTLVDAAKKAGVHHIVHLGTFGENDTTVPVFLWHQLVETYIEASGIFWTHIRANMFMELVFMPSFLSAQGLTDNFGGHRVGWVAADTIAHVAATVLREGPTKHHAKTYWLSTEILTGQDMAKTVSQVLGRSVPLNSGQDFVKKADASDAQSSKIEPEYAKSGKIIHDQIKDGKMGYICTVRDDAPYVTGKPSLTFRGWVEENKAALLKNISQ